MDKDIEKEINEIMTQINCSKNFKCYKSGLTSLCKAKVYGVESLILCLEDDPKKCKFSFPFSDLHFCQCPIRSYLIKKVKQ